GDPEPAPGEAEDVEVEVDEALPRPGVDVLELVGVAGEERRAPVVDLERGPVLVPPALARARRLVDPLVADALLARAALERDDEPAGAVVELDAVAVLEVLGLVLEVVHDDEDVGAGELVEVPEPGQVRRLV